MIPADTTPSTTKLCIECGDPFIPASTGQHVCSFFCSAERTKRGEKPHAPPDPSPYYLRAFFKSKKRSIKDAVRETRANLEALRTTGRAAARARAS